MSGRQVNRILGSIQAYVTTVTARKSTAAHSNRLTR